MGAWPSGGDLAQRGCSASSWQPTPPELAHRHVWCPLPFLIALFFLSIVACLVAPSSRRMPHLRSADRRLARHERAARRGYVRPPPDGHGFPRRFACSAAAAACPTLSHCKLKDALRTNCRAAVARLEWDCTADDPDDDPADLENAPSLPPAVGPPSCNPGARDACTQCDPAPGPHRQCMLVDLTDVTNRLANLEREKTDDDALAARCAASLLPKLKPIMMDSSMLAVDKAVSAVDAVVGKLLTPFMDRICVLERRICALEAALPTAQWEEHDQTPSTGGSLPRPARLQDLFIGARVLVDDLKAAELNGMTGTVVSSATANGRYGVAIPRVDAPKSINMRNLFVFDSTTSPAESGAAYHDQRPARPLMAASSFCKGLHAMTPQTRDR